MNDNEKLLIETLKIMSKWMDSNSLAISVESYIQEYGFLSEEAGTIVKGILAQGA